MHFLLVGAVLFLASRVVGTQPAAPERDVVQISRARVAEAVERFEVELGRAPTAADMETIRRRLVDDEVLFRYAISIGLHRQPVPARRLADIAAFVGTPAEASRARQAELAVELGLHRGDFVTRRLLVDAARRLILRVGGERSEPDQEAVAQYLHRHAEAFRGDEKVRISHVLVADDASETAVKLLERLRTTRTAPTEAAAVSAPSPVPTHLPLLDASGVERRFGRRFAERLFAREPASLPAGEWGGPLASRYGTHLVFVHERRDGDVADLQDVEDKIRSRLRLQAGERWYEERLTELRAEFPVTIDRDPP